MMCISAKLTGRVARGVTRKNALTIPPARPSKNLLNSFGASRRRPRKEKEMPRFIDADALLKHECKADKMGAMLVVGKGYILSAPTADVAPVVHGEWILVGTNEHVYETSVEEKCSLCGRYVYRYDTQPKDNFCPHCGADMRRESEGSK